MKAILVDSIRRIRPAPLASALAHITGLNKREFLQTEHGTFFVAPMSQFGFQLRHGEYEAATTAVLRRCLTPGAVFIDLGANEGYFTVLASKLVGPQGIVIAIEPQSRLQSVITANLEANNCRNVRVVKAVVSSLRIRRLVLPWLRLQAMAPVRCSNTRSTLFQRRKSKASPWETCSLPLK